MVYCGVLVEVIGKVVMQVCVLVLGQFMVGVVQGVQVIDFVWSELVYVQDWVVVIGILVIVVVVVDQ